MPKAKQFSLEEKTKIMCWAVAGTIVKNIAARQQYLEMYFMHRRQRPCLAAKVKQL
jgi:hypothetical protein